jgi:hypothetical protein
VGLATVFYCLRFEASLFVASYDAQGYGVGIAPRLHAGFILDASGIALHSHGTEKAENTLLLLRGADSTENTSHLIAIQLVHWRADCCLAKSYNIRSLRQSFQCWALKRVYGAVAWQCVDQIRFNTMEPCS